jgi:hypothetical protein
MQEPGARQIPAGPAPLTRVFRVPCHTVENFLPPPPPPCSVVYSLFAVGTPYIAYVPLSRVPLALWGAPLFPRKSPLFLWKVPGTASAPKGVPGGLPGTRENLKNPPPASKGRSGTHSEDRPSHPVDNSGHPIDNPGYPVDNPGYPVDNSGHPVDNPGHPVDNPSHPVDNPGHPAGNPGYSTGDYPAGERNKFMDFFKEDCYGV